VALDLIVEASMSYSDTPHSVELLWTSDRPVAETSLPDNVHKKQTSLPPAGFEPAVPARDRAQFHTLDIADTGIWQVVSIVRCNLMSLMTGVS
jgi:hypothetical protein